MRACIPSADFARAKSLVAEIQPILRLTGHRTRLLQIKNWLYECALEAREIDFAMVGFEGTRKLAGGDTRIFLEATVFLAICHLRRGSIAKAKLYVQEAVLLCPNNIQSPRRREQFHKRFLERLEEECVLAGLIEANPRKIEIDDLHNQAVKLIQRNEDDLTAMIGNELPSVSVQLLLDVQDYYQKQLPVPERKLLPPPTQKTNYRELGRKVNGAFKRVVWRVICDPKDDIHKSWSQGLAYVYDGKILVTALAAAFNGWKIGNIVIASAITALALRLGAATFCEAFAPDWLMIHVTEKD